MYKILFSKFGGQWMFGEEHFDTAEEALSVAMGMIDIVPFKIVKEITFKESD